MDCEICGRKNASFAIKVEGATVTVCRGCARHGKVLYSFEEEGGQVTASERPPLAFREEEEIVENYGAKIAEARKKRGMSIEELAKKILEKANYLDHIEKEKMLPTIAVARKLEKEFGIKLVEKTTVAHAEYKKGASADLTLGDLVQPAKKKKR